jgi:uncharacterized glyoxalase superfamily protein PhnB
LAITAGVAIFHKRLELNMKQYIVHYELCYRGSTFIFADSYEDATEDFYSLPIEEIVEYDDLNHCVDIQKIFECDLEEEYK